ncbi:MAG TPA: hypothetical protein VIF60_21230 [Burkholderiaceae bacterium]|jgi:uncharacterized lipoprotein
MFPIFRRSLSQSSLVFVLGAGLVAGLAGCSGMERQSGADHQVQLAAGWAEHSKPLLFHGMSSEPGVNVWFVPNILPRGTYRVIERKSDATGDTAELLDGYRFEVDSSEKDIYLRISSGDMNLVAVEEKYLVGLNGATVK